MPPKKNSLLDSISVHASTSSRFRSTAVADLITKSEVDLSSKASVYTQRTQGSQQFNLNYGIGDNDDIEFNREEINDVITISKEEEEMINKILELSRKGKIKTQNAFSIPIKLMHADQSRSANNKFWKFASELLEASMQIYDKRVQNVYLSAGSFEGKLSRIGFQIKPKKGQIDEENDDVVADEEVREQKDKEERQHLLKISVQNFQGSLNLDDQNIIGFQTLDKKQKIDLKNFLNKFIADPTFERTQKMFDSYSLRSLMLNIFELSTDLDVRIFHKSDLQWQKLKGQKLKISSNYQDKLFPQKHLQQNNQNQSLSKEYQACLQTSKTIFNSNELFAQIQKFALHQPEIQQDIIKRNPEQANKNQDQKNQKNFNFQDILKKQRQVFDELFYQFQGSYDQQCQAHRFEEIRNGEGLFEAHQTQSQTYSNQRQLSFSEQFINKSFGDEDTQSMPHSSQDIFYNLNQSNNLIEPIMPWQIEFKNLKLIKKRRNENKKQTGFQKKSKVKQSKINFDLQILDRKMAISVKNLKNQFQNRQFSNKFSEKNIIGMEFDKIVAQYQVKFNNNLNISKNKQISLQREISKSINQDRQDFIFDLDKSIDPNYKQGFIKRFDEQTKFNSSETTQQLDEHKNLFTYGTNITKNTIFMGNQMGVSNIREIKKIIVNEIQEIGFTTLQRMNQILTNLSSQQLFVIFLHLINQNMFQVCNQDQDQTKIRIFLSKRSKQGNNQVYPQQIDI